jgi:hypothetical protein
MWFTEFDGGRVARVTPTGFIQELRIPNAARPMGLVTGPDKRLWIAQFDGNRITRFNPPAPPIVTAAVPFSYLLQGSRTRFTKLAVTSIPTRGKVVARCSGSGCRFKKASFKGRRKVSLSKRVKRSLGGGARLEVSVSAPGLSTLVRQFRIRAGDDPVVRTLCRPPGARKAKRRCS